MESSSLTLIPAYLSNPRRTLRRLSDAKPFGLALFMFMLAVFARGLAYTIVTDVPRTLALYSITIEVGFWIGLHFLYIFLQSGIVHWVVTSSGSGGNPRSCLTLLLFNWTPYLLFVPLALLVAPLGSAGIFLLLLAEIPFFFQVLYLNTIGVQENYRTTFQQAFFAVLTPLGLMVVLGFLSFLYPIATLIALLFS